MLAAAATFSMSMAIIVGVYWLFVVAPEDKAARSLRHRLAPDASTRATKSELTKKTPPLSAVKLLDAVLVHSGSLVDPLQRLLALSALRVTVGVVLLASAFMAMLAFLLAYAQTSIAWIGLLAALVCGAIPYVYVRVAAARRLAQLEELFPQAMELIASSLRAGHAFTTGLLLVSEEVAEPLRSEFRLLYDQQNYGRPVPDVLKGLAERVPLLDVRIFITAVLTQRETGGNLAEVLDKLAALVRERFKIKRQVRAVSAHGRITGWILSLLPPAVATMLFFIAPDHIRILVEDPLGIQLVGAAVAMQLVGMLAIRRIVQVEF